MKNQEGDTILKKVRWDNKVLDHLKKRLKDTWNFEKV